MKALSVQQIETVSGGFGAVGAAFGAGAHLLAARGNATVGSTVRAAAIGAVTGGLGGAGAKAAGSAIGSAVVRGNQAAVGLSLGTINTQAAIRR